MFQENHTDMPQLCSYFFAKLNPLTQALVKMEISFSLDWVLVGVVGLVRMKNQAVYFIA